MFWFSVVFNCQVYNPAPPPPPISPAFKTVWFVLPVSGNTLGKGTIPESVSFRSEPHQQKEIPEMFQKGCCGGGGGAGAARRNFISFGATILIGLGTHAYTQTIKKK